MKFLLSTVVLTICSVGVFAQQGTDRELAGLRGKVKVVENWSQDTERDGKPIYKNAIQSADEYDQSGSLVKSTYHVSAGRSIYFLLDGKRVSKYEQLEGRPVPQLITVAGAPETPAPAENKGDPRYEHRYAYKFDSSGRIIAIEDYKNDGRLWETRKFTYDAAGRIAGETISRDGKPEFDYIFKYDAGGTMIEKESVWYWVNGGKETTLYRYSKIKADSRGNWTERTVTQGDGKDAEIIMVESRKIKYH